MSLKKTQDVVSRDEIFEAIRSLAARESPLTLDAIIECLGKGSDKVITSEMLAAIRQMRQIVRAFSIVMDNEKIDDSSTHSDPSIRERETTELENKLSKAVSIADELENARLTISALQNRYQQLQSILANRTVKDYSYELKLTEAQEEIHAQKNIIITLKNEAFELKMATYKQRELLEQEFRADLEYPVSRLISLGRLCIAAIRANPGAFEAGPHIVELPALEFVLTWLEYKFPNHSVPIDES